MVYLTFICLDFCTTAQYGGGVFYHGVCLSDYAMRVCVCVCVHACVCPPAYLSNYMFKPISASNFLYMHFRIVYDVTFSHNGPRCAEQRTQITRKLKMTHCGWQSRFDIAAYTQIDSPNGSTVPGRRLMCTTVLMCS